MRNVWNGNEEQVIRLHTSSEMNTSEQPRYPVTIKVTVLILAIGECTLSASQSVLEQESEVCTC